MIFIFDVSAIKMCRCGGAHECGHNKKTEHEGSGGKLARAPRPPHTWAPPTMKGDCGEWENSGDGVTDAGWRVNREDCRLLVHPRAMSRVMGLPLAFTGVPFPKPNLVQPVVDRM